MGIGMMCSAYVFVRDGQDLWAEYSKIVNFVQSYVLKYAENKGKGIENFSLEFINYGRTQIVYVLTDKQTGEKITILAKQPVVEYGKIAQEATYLSELNMVDSSVVAPIDYFCDGEQELYVAPYISRLGVLQVIKNGECMFQSHFIGLKILQMSKKELLMLV